MSKSPTIIEITWQDSISEQGWQTLEDAKHKAATEPNTYHSVGYLIDDTPTYTLIALSRNQDATYLDQTLQIPAAAIITTRTLT